MRQVTGWLYFSAPLAVLVALFALLAFQPRLGDALRFAVFDAYQRLEPREYVPLPVTIVDVDEESLRRLGQWPWPRTLLARLIDRLAAAGVSVVGLDIILSEPDRTSPSQVLPLWPDGALDEPLRERLAALPDHDALLAQSLERVQAAGGFVLTGEELASAPPVRARVEVVGGDATRYLPAFRGVVTYLPQLQAALDGVGSFNLISDFDGVSRRLHLFYGLQGIPYPSFAAEVLRLAQRSDRYEIRVGDTGGIDSVKVGDLRIPTDGEGRVWLHFTGRRDERYLPAWQVLDDGFDPARLQDHVVLVGTSAAGLKDLRSTPLDRAAAGVSLHAAVIEQALLGEFLLRPGWAEAVEYLYALALALVLLVLLRRTSALGCAAVGALAVAAALAFSWFSYLEFRWLVDPVLPSLAALAVYLLATTINYLRTEGERRQIRRAFGQYLAPAVVEQLTANPGMLKLGGERRETTFLFSDVAGFTSLTENLEPAVLVHVLNRYLDGTCRIVLDHGGTIDKIVGDALHVMFNAPGDQPDHADRAVRCALALDAWCQAFVAEQVADGLAMGVTRIGVNTGVTVVGNFGGAARFDYTAHGDAINTAARLESVNKHLGTRVCVSGTTRDACRAPPPMRPVGELVLKGKQQGLMTFEPLAEDADPARAAAYDRAFAQMRDGGDGAAAVFADLAARWPDDPLARFHAARLAAGERGVRIVMDEK